MRTLPGVIRALRTVAHFATGVASYRPGSAFAALPGHGRLFGAARRRLGVRPVLGR